MREVTAGERWQSAGGGGGGLYLAVMLKIKPAEPLLRVHWSRHSSRAQLYMLCAAFCAHARSRYGILYLFSA